MNRSSNLYKLSDDDTTDSEINALRAEVSNLKERIRSQQEMLESTTKFLMGTQERLEYKKDEIERKNTELFDSISYASYVQSALVPSQDKLNPYFKEAFIGLAQKDVIGGDLPYVYSFGDEIIVAAVDCTGHGVSGAMLTALAHSFLNEIFSRNTFTIIGLDRAISILNSFFSGVFNVEGNNQLFGLDIAILRLNVRTREAEFAGAGRPLLMLRGGNLTRMPKTGLGIGLNPSQKFTSEKFKFQENDKFYLYSDGMTDQLGDRIPKKFSDRRFRELIEETSHLRLKKQKEVIFDFLKSWQGQNEQTDDQILIGLKTK